MKEIWKDIEGYEGLYQVSNYGNIKSLSRVVKNAYGIHRTEEKILKPIDDLCKEVFVGKHKKEIQNSIEHLIV